jgi:gamma-glutamyl-gamma-aminobutyrate hydrolase PuuD
MFSGHTLSPIPNNLDHYDQAEHIVANSDIVVFTGGNSMVPGTWQYNEARLATDDLTLDLALRYNKPILGISRGCQFLNIKFGGSISPNENHQEDHNVYYNETTVSVCSRHEEILSTIPSLATVLVTDESGNCESWQLDNMITVLWHPERMNTHWLPDEAYDILGMQYKG